MPIEIKEMHIKINLDEGGSQSTSNNSGSGGSDEIIKACIEGVMEILERQKER
jgi:hypothetical protein